MNEKFAIKRMVKDLKAFPNHTTYLKRNEQLFEMKKPATIDALIALLDLPERELQCAAVVLLGRMKALPAVPTLLELVDHRDASVREKAVLALGEIGDPSSVPKLIAAAQKLNMPKIAQALGEIGDKRAVDALVEQLAFPAMFRTAAAEALKKLDAGMWADIVKGSWDDFDRLARCGDDRPIEAAVRYLYDGRYASHCKEIAEGFAHIREPGDEIIDALIHCVAHPDGAVRKQAIASIAILKSAGATDAVIRALGDPDHQVYEEAAYALGEIGDERACPHLIRVIDGKSSGMTMNAAEALSKLHCKEAIAPLKAFLESDSFLKNVNGIVACVNDAIRKLEHE